MSDDFPRDWKETVALANHIIERDSPRRVVAQPSAIQCGKATRLLYCRIAELEAERDALRAENEKLSAELHLVMCAELAKIPKETTGENLTPKGGGLVTVHYRGLGERPLCKAGWTKFEGTDEPVTCKRCLAMMERGRNKHG